MAILDATSIGDPAELVKVQEFRATSVKVNGVISDISMPVMKRSTWTRNISQRIKPSEGSSDTPTYQRRVVDVLVLYDTFKSYSLSPDNGDFLAFMSLISITHLVCDTGRADNASFAYTTYKGSQKFDVEGGVNPVQQEWFLMDIDVRDNENNTSELSATFERVDTEWEDVPSA